MTSRLVKVRGKLSLSPSSSSESGLTSVYWGCFNCSMPAARFIIVITRHARSEIKKAACSSMRSKLPV